MNPPNTTCPGIPTTSSSPGIPALGFRRSAPKSVRAASDLNALFAPRSIAVIGATERPGSVGAAVMRNLLDSGFAGSVLPINPSRKSVFGLPTYSRIGDVDTDVDLTVVCTPAATVASIVRQCGVRGIRAMIIISAGFRETGPQGVAMENALRTELDHFPHMRVLGPNCVGLIVPSVNLNASFARHSAKLGGVAFLSQSGALCAAILGWAHDEGIGFSHFVSIGNMLDVGFGDLLDALADDPQATSVVLYVESITNAPRFLSAARRCTARKPVIVYKAGRSAVAAKAAASHTGALAGEDAVYGAAFEECGIIRVTRLDDLLSTTKMLGLGHWPQGSRLAIVTNAGGPGVIAADALMAGKGALAQLSVSTMTALDGLLPQCWSHGNPVDVIGDAPPERLGAALDLVIRDDNVDAALVIVTPQAMIDLEVTARAVAQIVAQAAKPTLATWMGGTLAREGVNVLRAQGIPTYDTPEQAVGAFLHLAAHARYAGKSAVRTNAIPLLQPAEHMRMRQDAAHFLESLTGTLNETPSKSLLLMYGIPVNETIVAHSCDQAIASARMLGYPVALKVLSPQISHKTEVRGVQLDLRSDDDVVVAFDHIRQWLAAHRPDAHFEGVTIQRMLDRSCGLEMIVGVKRDSTFGPIVLVGAGGITAEALSDRAIGLAPVSYERASELLRSLRIWPLMENFRGRGPLDIESLISVIVRISLLIADHPDVLEGEANPVLSSPKHAIALDARVIMNACSSK